MTHSALLEPAAYVWLPALDSGRAEPAPAGAEEIRAVHLARAVRGGDVVRTVLLETGAGYAPLPRRVRLHGDAAEGWDWGWHGSAPLETSLNLLASFVHPKAAWRLQWGFYDALLHDLPVAGGSLDGDHIRGWIREHAWVGRQTSWAVAAEAARTNLLAWERERSTGLPPAERAARVADILDPAQAPAGHRWPDHGPGSAAFEAARAAAVLAGAPAPERWSTLAALARRLPPTGSAARRAWDEAASPRTPCLPDPATVLSIAGIWDRLAARSPAERAVLLGELMVEHAAAGGTAWSDLPMLALPLGAGFQDALRGDAHLAGDPVAATATLRALQARMLADTWISAAAAALGLTGDVIAAQIRAAHRLHTSTLRDTRRAMETAAAAAREYVMAAEAARLPRGRSRTPPPSSEPLRRWILAAPEGLLKVLARAARGPAGPLTVRAALRGSSLTFPDPPGTVAQAIAWYLEERAPWVLDLPTFIGRGDGLVSGPNEPAAARGRRGR
ncbi:MAG TPA: DUF6166 domain-containing protein [Longimicrobium sp.]|nr:DUF6166 domain-containing protein [Longimicrobium sp.]